MAIRIVGTWNTAAGQVERATQSAGFSGWHDLKQSPNVVSNVQFNTTELDQPARLTRPSEGGAYPGAWTGSISAPDDAHIPMEFSTVASTNIVVPAATGSGVAPPPSIEESSNITAPPAIGSGVAPPPTIEASSNITAPAASGSGVAPPPAVTTSVDKDIICVPATGSGVAPPPAVVIDSNISAVPATGSGVAPPPSVVIGKDVTAVPAVGSGVAPPPTLEVSSALTVPPASGSGVAPPPVVSISGAVVTVTCPPATGAGVAMPVSIQTNVKNIPAPPATGLGTAAILTPARDQSGGNITLVPAIGFGAASPPLTPSRQTELATVIPFNFVPARRLPALIHEIESAHGGSRIPIVAGWSGTEIANGGYEGATGRISRAEYMAHRDIYRYGATMRTLEADTGEVVWAGDLVDPVVESDQVVLSARGWSHLAEKEFQYLLYQTRDLSRLVRNDDSGTYVTVDVVENARYSHMGHGALVFKKPSGLGSHTVGSEATLMFLVDGCELSRIAFQFSMRFTDAKSPRIRVSSGQFSGAHGADNLNNYGNAEYEFTGSQGADGAGGIMDVDLSMSGADTAGRQTPWPVNPVTNYVIVGVFDNNRTSELEWTATLSNLRINGIVPYQRVRPTHGGFWPVEYDTRFSVTTGLGVHGDDDWNDHWTSSDLVADIAARLRIPYEFMGKPWGRDGADALPSEWPAGSYADPLDWAALISGWRWRILDNGWGPYLDFAPWKSVQWDINDRENQVRPVPLERFDRCSVEYTHAAGGTGLVKHRVDRPYRLYPSRDYGKVSLPAIYDVEHAHDVAERLLRRMSKGRWGGDANVVSMRGPDGIRRSPYQVHAGDVAHSPGEGYRCRIASITKDETGAQLTFESTNTDVDRMTARRGHRLLGSSGATA